MSRRPTSTVLLLAALCSTVVGAACADGSPADSAQTRPDPTSSDLLNSVRSPGLGLEPSVPVAEAPTPQSAAPGAQAPRGEQEVPLDSLGYNEGSSTASVRVLEFSDFGCGYCRQFHLESYPALMDEYMETGKVEWKYVTMVSGMFENSLTATRGAECAGEQGRFPAMRDRLFEEQRAWKSAGNPGPIVRELAAELELDMEQFDSCVETGRRDNRIRMGTRIFREAGGRGTPSFFVVGYAPIPGAIPLELFRQVLDTALVEAAARQGPGR